MARLILTPLLALMGASTGLTMPIIAETMWPIAPVAYPAAALGALAGVAFAQTLAIRRPSAPDGSVERPWLLQLGVWMALAFVITLALSLAEGWTLRDPILWGSSIVGAVTATLAYPFGWWLSRRAERAKRARRGSLVAGVDHRSLWSVAATTVAVECAVALPAWHRLELYRSAAWPPLELSVYMLAGALAVATLVLSLDYHAVERAKRLNRDSRGLESLDPFEDGGDAGPALDLGLGHDVYGRVNVAAQYRGQTQRIPAIIGNPTLALGALQAALKRSLFTGSLLLALAILAFATV